MAPVDMLRVLGDLPLSFHVIVGVLLIGIVHYAFVNIQRPCPGIPVIKLDPKAPTSSAEFAMHQSEITAKGLKSTDGPFQVFTSSGYKVILPNKFADELRNNPDMSFTEAGKRDLHINIPGMEGFREGFRPDSVVTDVVRVKLTQSLNLVTEDLVEEGSLVINSWLGDAKDWSNVQLKPFVLDVVARVSSRVFGGKELARDKEWVEVSKQYTVGAFGAVNKIRDWPAILRPFVCRFLPECRRAQADVRTALRLAKPQVDKRLRTRDEAIAAGASPKSLPDVFSWMIDMAKGRELHFAETQLALSMAAIHTTTEMVMRCVGTICDQPDIQQPLREEIIAVLKADGWAKTSLYKMRLLDSFIKECMRFHKMSSLAMMRVATKPVVLSDGTVLPKGSHVRVVDSGSRDPNIYKDPETFDAWRYLRMREQPGQENHHQFVTPSVDNLGFGLGRHSCPGRFFASNEIKIILCFLLVDFEWRYGPDQRRLPDLKYESSITANPATMVQAKKRNTEMDVLQPTG